MAEDRELARALVLLQKLPGRIDALASLAASLGASSMAATPLALERNKDLSTMRADLRADIAAALPVLERYYQASLQVRDA